MRVKFTDASAKVPVYGHLFAGAGGVGNFKYVGNVGLSLGYTLELRL